MLPEPSDEQRSIIKSLNDNNVVIDSVAGSGKTTTNLLIAKNYPDDNILLLTYNARLKFETRDKIKDLKLSNITAHSYHSFCCSFYGKCFNDIMLKEMLAKKVEPRRTISYDIIIVDECQDMTPLYFEVCCKIFDDNDNKSARVCVLGDQNQSIYGFNGADPRFISLADNVFLPNKRPWVKLNLSHSFRVTKEMAYFVNRCMLENNRIKSKKVSGNMPRYIVTDCFGKKFGSKGRAFKEVKSYLDKGYGYDDLFVIAPSVKSSKNPIRQLANELSEKGYPVFAPANDDEKLDQQVMEGKIVFSTFHQVKGLERKVVFVFNFDCSYFDLFKKDKNPRYCPNELYVATTRATEHLVLFHHYDNDYLPFINPMALKKYCDVHYDVSMKVVKFENKKNIKTYVTDLARHLPQEVIDKTLEYVKIEEINKIDKSINIDVKSEQKFGYENVSEITGTAIPAYFDYVKNNKFSLLRRLLYDTNIVHDGAVAYADDKGEVDDLDVILVDDEVVIVEKDAARTAPADILEDMNPDKLDMQLIEERWGTMEAFILYVANRWNAHTSGYVYKINQIINYDWLSHDNLDKCVERLHKLNISDKARFEVRFELENEVELRNRKLIGFVDCIDSDNDSVYEFKCVSQLNTDHFLQLAVYMYMMKMYYYNKSYYDGKKNIEKGDTITFHQNKTKYTATVLNVMREYILIYNNDTDMVDKIPNSTNVILKNKTYMKRHECDKKFYLYNNLDDQKFEISATLEDLKKMMDYLIFKKYIGKNELTDEEFIKKMIGIREIYK